MSEETPRIDFSLVLASSVHDMKNSLSMVLHSVDELTTLLPEVNAGHPAAQRLATLHYEASRVNNDLVQLLTLYKLENGVAGISLDQHELDDFLLEQAARYEPLFAARGVECSVDVEPALHGTFDRDLVGGIVTTIVANAIRYCSSAIRLSASVPAGDDAQYALQISVTDDGSGFPPEMLKAAEGFSSTSDFGSGSTHLGLYFADRIAKLHRRDGLEGAIRLSNHTEAGSACFELLLP